MKTSLAAAMSTFNFRLTLIGHFQIDVLVSVTGSLSTMLVIRRRVASRFSCCCSQFSGELIDDLGLGPDAGFTHNCQANR
jgi:hypothetical protein